MMNINYHNLSSWRGRLAYFVIMNLITPILTFIAISGIFHSLLVIIILLFLCGATLFVVKIKLKQALLLAISWLVIVPILVYITGEGYVDKITGLKICFGWLFVYLAWVQLILPSILFASGKIPLRIFAYSVILFHALVVIFLFLNYGSLCSK